MDFKEKRALQKSIKEKLSKLEAGELSFKELRSLQKDITSDFIKLEEAKAVELPAMSASTSSLIAYINNHPAYISKNPEGLSESDIDLIRKFVKETGEIADEGEANTLALMGVEEGLRRLRLARGVTEPLPTPTYDKLVAGDFLNLPAKEFVERLKEAAKEIGEEDALTERIVDPAMAWKDKREEVATEGVDLDIDYVNDFLDGKVHPEVDPALESAESSEEGEETEGDQEIETPDTDLETSVEDDQQPEETEIENVDPEKPDDIQSDDIPAETEGIATETSEIEGEEKPAETPEPEASSEEPPSKPEESGEVAEESAASEDEELATIAKESEEAINSDQETHSMEEVDDMLSETATESTESDFEDFELDQETEDQLTEEIKGDYQLDPELEKEEIATEKVEHIKKLWDYAKKIVLRARFDKSPSGDKKKDEEVITGGKAWGFVQDRYQKLKSGKIKARKPATESVDDIDVELIINEDIQDDPEKPATESVEGEIEDDEEIII